MVQYSDNTAGNIMLDHVGIASVNATANELGLKNTRVQRRFMDLDAVAVQADDAGKAQYVLLLQFTSRPVADAFSAAVVRAVLEHEPTALDDGSAVA